MLKEGRCRWNIAFSCYSEGLAAGQGSIESLKFVDPSGLTLQGVVTIEVLCRAPTVQAWYSGSTGSKVPTRELSSQSTLAPLYLIKYWYI